MKRLIIKKLIVISQSESRSLEIPFSSGLNIICGKNKTGKSSVIKSIFTAFGCECRTVEKDWKNLISNYIIYFRYGTDNYCITREKKKFQIFLIEDNQYKCVIVTDHFHEYSNALMQLLQVNMPCVSKEGQEFNITPPLLFRFQYIDQDNGWNKIADSFSNVSYIKDWKPNTNKYVSGYLSEEYFLLRSEITRAFLIKDELQKKFSNNQDFIAETKAMMPEMPDSVGKSPEIIEADLNFWIETLDLKRQLKFQIRQIIGELENNIFVTNRKIEMINSSFKEVEKDIEFAMSLDEEILCPICGSVCTNSLEKQMSLTVESATAENLFFALSEEVAMTKTTLDEHNKKYAAISDEVSFLIAEIRKAEREFSYTDFLKNEGRQEFYNKCLEQLESLTKEIDQQLLLIAQLNEKVNALKSRKRSKEIRGQIEEYCRLMAAKIDISKTFIRLRDFVQVIDRTGSETPRIIYMYQTALYLYNLYRMDSPFNFLVIDTPNQQGQDVQNLNNIYESFSLFCDPKGQVILGTEREIGYEKKASHVIYFQEKRRCLTSEKYSEHKTLLAELLSIAKNMYIN